MKRTIAALMIVAAAGTLAAAGQQQEKSFLVTVIPDKNGPVTTLTAADFVVREGGERREVVLAEPSSFPLAVTLLIDMTQPQLLDSTVVARELRRGVAAFVSTLRAAQANAKIALVEVGAGAQTIAGFDAPPETLDAAIQKLMPIHPADAIVVESIGIAAASLQPMQTPRRAIVVVDFNSSEVLSETTFKRMTVPLQQSGATVWSVSVRLPRSNASRREDALNRVTAGSGGTRQVVNAASGLEAMLKKVAESLASQYIVNFKRPGDAPMKPVQMETKQGLKVNLTPMSK